MAWARGRAPYAATQGALEMLTKGMCADLPPHGTQVSALGPGPVGDQVVSVDGGMLCVR
ncbi:MAG: hypothetical protein M3Y71_16840 [Actinomycetota bacterium]|nr:hypothetical protein [Actinomycetota bacterium]